MRGTETGRSRGPAFLPADLRPDPQGGLYQSLYKRLRGFILDGAWPPGTRLPSSRVLAADLNVSRNTAILAVEQLIADGWAESRSRSGVYVAGPALPVRAPEPARPATAELPPFALQRPATDLFPAATWKQLQTRAWAEIEPDRLLGADPGGDSGLREAIARLVCAPRGLRCHPDQILIVPSATFAVDLVAATLLRPGECAAVEEPTRPGVRRLLQGRGADLHPLPVDAEGLDPSSLTEAAPSVIWTTPAAHFPTGATLSPARRAALIDWARTKRGWIVEDDRDADAWFDDRSPPSPIAAAAGDRTILIGSFNRLLFPGLCVAFLVAPAELVERLRAVQAGIGGRASLAAQLALRDFIGEGHLARHLRRRRAGYTERRAALADALQQPALNAAGLHVVLDVPQAHAAAERLAAAALGGIALSVFAQAPAEDRRLALGLGATLDTIIALAPQLRAVLAPSQGPC